MGYLVSCFISIYNDNITREMGTVYSNETTKMLG